MTCNGQCCESGPSDERTRPFGIHDRIDKLEERIERETDNEIKLYLARELVKLACEIEAYQYAWGWVADIEKWSQTSADVQS